MKKILWLKIHNLIILELFLRKIKKNDFGKKKQMENIMVELKNIH